jgi:glyoxylase-like metal-dependent hydrolase (beta-lactamase superfamily II)
MSQAITTIGLDGTNSYLVKTASGFILIDTNFPFQRSKLEEALAREGCKPGNLKLIVMTHGDIDHTGNGAYLRDKYKARIAMHKGDTGMCMKDGITRDRGEVPKDFPLPLMILWLLRGFVRFAIGQMLWRKPFDRFEPDILLEEGQSLTEYGFDAKILYTPGHSEGSISMLTDSGDLICGDMFNNVRGRILVSTDKDGLERLKGLGIETVYPGHGEPFSIDQIAKDSSPDEREGQNDTT